MGQSFIVNIKEEQKGFDWDSLKMELNETKIYGHYSIFS